MGALSTSRWMRMFVVVLAIACLMPAATASADQTIALSSGSFSFEVDAGQTGDGEIVVICDGDQPIKVLVYVADVAIDESGEQTYPLPEGRGAATQSTPSSWFRVFMPADSKAVGNTPYLEMEPGERIPVKFDFTPPSGTAPGDHNIMLFFEMFEFAQESEGAAVQIAGRIGSRVALRVNGDVIEKMSVRPFEVPAFAVGTRIPYDFTVVNGGNLNKPIEASVTLFDRSEKEIVSSVVGTESTVYARSNLAFSGILDTIASRFGPHTVEVRILYSEEGDPNPRELVEERSIWLFPLWMLIGAAVLLFVGATALAARFMRRRPRADHASTPRPGRGDDERRRRREERAAADGAASVAPETGVEPDDEPLSGSAG